MALAPMQWASAAGACRRAAPPLAGAVGLRFARARAPTTAAAKKTSSAAAAKATDAPDKVAPGGAGSADADAKVGAAREPEPEADSDDELVRRLNAAEPFRRQSKLAEFGDFKIGLSQLPPDLKRNMRRLLKDQSMNVLRDDARRVAQALQTWAPMTRLDLADRGASPLADTAAPLMPPAQRG